MASSMTPSLFTSKDQLTSVPDRVADLLYFAIANPGSTTSMWVDNELSIPKLIHTYESDLDTLTSKLNSSLNRVLGNMFQSEGVTASISYSVIDKEREIYKLIIRVTYGDGSLVLDSSSIIIDKDGKMTLNLK